MKAGISAAKQRETATIDDATARQSGEEAWKLSEERLGRVLAATRDGLWDWDLATNEVYYSPRWKEMLGYADHELENCLATWERLVEPADRAVVLQAAADFTNSGSPSHEVEFRMRHKDGHSVWILSRSSRGYDAQGKPLRMVGTHVDVTAINQARQLLEIQRDLAIALATAQDLRSAFSVLLAAALRLPGFDCGGIYRRDEVSGDLELVAHHGLSEAFVRAAKTHSGDSPQARLVAAGELVYAKRGDLPAAVAANLATENLEALAAVPLREKDRVIGILNVSSHHHAWIEPEPRVALESLAAQAEGVIARIEARTALQHAERQLRLALEGAELGTWAADNDSGFFDASLRARELHGLPLTGPLTADDTTMSIHPDHRADVAAAKQRAIECGEPFYCEYRTLVAGDGERWISSQARAFDHDGKTRWYGIARDITRRKQSETDLRGARAQLELRVAERTAELEAANAALRQESLRLEWALAAAQAGTSKWEMGDPTMKWDNRERALFGFAEDALVSVDDLMERVHPDDRGEIIDFMAKPIPPDGHNDWNHEFRIIHPVLGIRWIAGIGRVWRDAVNERIHVAGINFDITERKQAEQQLREWSETLERRVAERTLELNQSEARFRQLAAATFEGIGVSKDARMVDGNPQYAQMHGYELAEMIGRPVADFVAPESRQLVDERIRGGITTTYQFVALRKDGSTFPAEGRAQVMEWRGGRARVTALRDLTATKAAEAQLQSQRIELEHANRFAMVSEVSTGVMHQIGQPLTAITTNAAAARMMVSACESKTCGSLEVLKDIESDLARLRQVMANLRTLAHPERSNRVLISLHDLLSDVSNILREEARLRAFRLTVEHADHRLELRADKIQIEQVVLNLVRNSFESAATAEPERRVVGITTRAVDHGRVEICIRDAGPGIAPEGLPRLFSPFFTTKPNGFGIGLRLSQTIIQAHGGTIEGFNHRDGPGATFRVVLPTAYSS